MTSGRSVRRLIIAAWIWGLAASLVLGIALTVVEESDGSMVFAWYPGTCEFIGFQRFRGTDYFALKWVPDTGEVGPCPIVIHGEGGDVGAAEFTEPTRLLERGWVEVPPVPMSPDWVAAIGRTQPDPGLPRVVEYGQGDLRVATRHTNGVLTGVWVVVVDPRGERPPKGVPSEREHMATRVGTKRFPVSVGGRRIALPISETDLVQALGPPEGRRSDY
jgi:hypothetical protein